MKININRNSWHYRWYEYLADTFTADCFREPTSVCPYFWGFVKVNLQALFITLLLVASVTMATAPVWGGIYYLITGDEQTGNFALLISVLWGAGIIIACGFWANENKHRFFKSLDEATSTGFTGVTRSTFKSFRDKVCPMIEYKGE